LYTIKIASIIRQGFPNCLFRVPCIYIWAL